MKLRYIKLILIFAGISVAVSCKKYFDINLDPDRLPATNNTVYPQLLTSTQVNLGFEGGSDLFRYTTLFVQQMSGLASQPNQTYEYYRYNITPTDQNNLWSIMFATSLSDLELIIKQATAAGSTHYSGVAKILKAYEYIKVVDTWGDVPYKEAQQLITNTQPKFDDDVMIYDSIISILNRGIAEVGATTSFLSPGSNSVIYPGAWTAARPFWIKLANTLKLKVYLHYSKKDPAYCVQQINALVNSSSASFMSSNADNMQVQFYDVAGQRNPISQFEVNRPNYLFADSRILSLMTSKGDPRRPYYFTSFPYQGISLPISISTNAATATGNVLLFNSTTGAAVGMNISGTNIPVNTTITAVTANSITISNNVTGTGVDITAPITVAPSVFTGVSATAPPPAANNNYSRIHTFLRGAVTAGAAPPFTYSGAVPQRLLPYSEYCFIRAEAALMGVGAPGDAQTFYRAGITASMQEVGTNIAGITPISANDIVNYLAVNGTLSGTPAQQLQKVIEEKYVALFGVPVEPWTDWRRTGYPALTPTVNGVTTQIPRSLFYPQSEVDANPNCPSQKPADLQTRVFWDN